VDGGKIGKRGPVGCRFPGRSRRSPEDLIRQADQDAEERKTGAEYGDGQDNLSDAEPDGPSLVLLRTLRCLLLTIRPFRPEVRLLRVHAINRAFIFGVH